MKQFSAWFLRVTEAKEINQKVGLEFWRERVYTYLLRAGVLLGLIGGPGIFLAGLELGQGPYAVGILFTVVVLLTLVPLRDSPYNLRVIAFCALIALQGVTALAGGGGIASSFFWFFAVAPMASLLLGLNAGMLVVGVNFLLLGLGTWGIATQTYWLSQLADYELLEWGTFAINFISVNFIATIPVGILVRGLATSSGQVVERDQELRHQEKNYRSMFDAMLNGIMDAKLILDDEGLPSDFRYISTNRAFRDLTGLDTVDGKLVSDIFPDFRASNQDALDRYYLAAFHDEVSRYESYFAQLDSWFSIFLYSKRRGEFTLVFDNVTEQKVAEKQIESLSRFPKENPFPVLRIRDDFRIAYANGASTPLLKQWGRHMGEVIPEAWHAQVRDALNIGEITFSDVEMGSKVFSLAFVPISGNDYVNVYGADITKRVHTENKLRDSEQSAKDRLRRLQALRTIDQAITSTLNLEEVLDSVLAETLSLLDVDAAAILLVDEDDWLTYSAGAGFNTNEIVRSMVHVGEGVAGMSAQELELHWVEDARDPAKGFTRQGLLKAEDFIAYYAAPLISRGSLLGILEAYRRDSEPLDEEAREFLVAIAGQASIAIEDAKLFTDLAISKAELEETYDRTLEGWVTALDLRDNETAGHTRRVSEITLNLAKAVGVSEEDLGDYWRGALLHDVGKMAIPDEILLKPGALTDEEWDVMKKHPYYAYEWLKDLGYLRKALDIPYAHHEKWDGSGYPQGLKKTDIPLAARIFAVVDVYDALTSDRPYRKAWSREKTLDYIAEEAGTHFDPDIVAAFLALQ